MKAAPQKVHDCVIQIQKQLEKLDKMGYILDFVEDSHTIVHVKSLKEEMGKSAHSTHIDTDQYVVAVLK